MTFQNEIEFVEVSYLRRREMERRFDSLHHSSNALNGRTVHRNRFSRMAGLLGEVIFEQLYPNAKLAKDISFDYLYKGRKIDVKCKLRNHPPRITDDASIFEYQLANCTADVYYFMSTTMDFERVWLCGWIRKLDLIQHPKRRVWKKGEMDKKNGKVFGADTLNLSYKFMNRIKVPRFEIRF